MVDLTPWDKKGKSFMGLKRNQTRTFGLIFITVAILMMTPPFIPSPDDIINIGLANFITEHFSMLPKDALILTYTLIPWILFLIGITIYPYNTRSLYNGYISKLKKSLIKLKKNPVILIILIFIAYYVFQWYKTIIIGM